jgi:diguanylate cyclase (GGDEF)-like protein
MSETMPGNDLIRLADLEWLDLSDLVRMDDDWRRTLAMVTRLHLAISVMLAVVVLAYGLFVHSAAPAEMAAMAGVVLGVGGMGYFVLSARDDEQLMRQNLRPTVLLSIVAVSLMVFLLRDLQGDYYLLYLLPLVSAAGYLGFTGGLLAGIASAVSYAVVFFLSPVSLAPGSLSALLLRALIFVLASSLLGLIAERHLSLLSALRVSHTQAIQLAVTDTKTGLFNQRFLQARMPSEIAKGVRSKSPIAFLVMDVDGLDEINREHGYSAGDAVLQTVGRVLQKQLRVTDVPSRWGVDELGTLLYNSDATGAEVVSKRVTAELAKEFFVDPTTGKPFTVTVSQGIAAFPAHTQEKSGKELVERAYQAMRRSKAQTGHPVIIWS